MHVCEDVRTHVVLDVYYILHTYIYIMYGMRVHMLYVCMYVYMYIHVHVCTTIIHDIKNYMCGACGVVYNICSCIFCCTCTTD